MGSGYQAVLVHIVCFDKVLEHLHQIFEEVDVHKVGELRDTLKCVG